MSIKGVDGNLKKKTLVLSFFVMVLAVISICLLYKQKNETIILQLGTFSGSMYDLPDWQAYKALDEAIAKFEKVNPKIKVTYKSGILKGDYSEQIAQSIIKGKEPDVLYVLPGDFNTFASIGILKDLEENIKNDTGFDINRMYVNAVQFGQLKGIQYALPKEVDPEVMFVNKTLLKKEGIELPKEDWTWKDFYEICKRITKDTDKDGKIDQFGVVGFNWQNAVYTNGQQLFDMNGNKTNFSNDGVIEAIKFMVSLTKLNQNFKVSLQDYDEGKVAFRPFPFSAYRAYRVYPYKIIRYGEFDWECIKLPRGPNGKNASQLNSFLVGISARSKHEKEAWEFLKFLTYNKDVQMDVFRYSHGMPVLKDVAESGEADKELSKYNLEQIFMDKKALGEVVEQSIATPRFHKYEECMDIADKEIFKLINEGEDVEGTMTKLNYKINAFLKQ